MKYKHYLCEAKILTMSIYCCEIDKNCAVPMNILSASKVVEVLEEDEDFKKKLHNATEEEIRQGTIADHVDLLSHKVRTKLDELKRMEIEYQKRLKRQERDHLNGINERNFWSPMFDENKDTFEVEDLRKLLHKVFDLCLEYGVSWG